jgi:hypothetical protein
LKSHFGYIVIFGLIFFLESCCGCDVSKPEEAKPVLTFAVAGHVYGNPDTYTSSIYPPFLAKLKQDHAVRKFDFLFLTGDVVARSNDTIWNTVISELDSLNLTWWIAPGNHDLGLGYLPICKKADLVNEDQRLYHFLSVGENEFMVLNTSVSGWTVDSVQLADIKKHLAGLNARSTESIFVFTHQLWWERNTPESFQLDSLRPNSMACYTGESDFWQDAFPYFDSTGIDTWFFAGDMGSWHTLPSYYEDHHKKFHFYGSGMGGGTKDNYLIVEVYQNGRVDIEKREF